MGTAQAIATEVQTSFGDMNEIVITKSDIASWINAGQREIARETLYRTASTTTTGDTIRSGLAVPSDYVIMQRVYYGSDPLALFDRESIDRLNLAEVPDGTPSSYFMLGESIYLFPNPVSGDATVVTIHYVDLPTAIADTDADNLDIPLRYSDDLIQYVMSRAHQKNENFRAAEVYYAKFQQMMAQRKLEGQSRDDSFHVVGADYMDYEDSEAYYDGV